MAFARQALADAPVLFAHRYITRPAEAGHEAHVPLSPAEFATRRRHGLFALSWRSHGLDYGIGIEVEHWLARGCVVVANGSRAAFPAALARFPGLLPVLITAAPETLRARLIARGREDAIDVEERLAGAAALPLEHPDLAIIANDGPVEAAGRTLVALLRCGLPAGSAEAEAGGAPALPPEFRVL